MKKVVVFSKNNCPWCVKVKKLLNSFGVKFVELNIEENDTAADLAIAWQFKTMPQVIADDKFIGGYEATHLYLVESRKMSNGG
jgi:glutaredoxin